MNAFWAKIFEETRAVPMTLMFLIGAYVGMGYLFRDHVSQQEMAALRATVGSMNARIDGVKEQLRYDHIDSELHKTESDLFALGQHQRELLEAKKPVDQVVLLRIDELTSRHEELLRQLAHISPQVRE